ncbi:MAG: hypothetical protein ACSLFO_14905 [Acidimicrobiales bacterium]
MTDSPPTDDQSSDIDERPGNGLVNASFAGTGALVVAGLAGVASPDDFGGLTAIVSGGLFAVGVVAFLYGYGAGVVRSSDEQVTLAGLFLLSQTAPKVIRLRLRIAFAVQIVVAVAAAVVRPYTSVAFAVLAPMLGLGLMATWGARYGAFSPKEPSERGRGR